MNASTWTLTNMQQDCLEYGLATACQANGTRRRVIAVAVSVALRSTAAADIKNIAEQFKLDLCALSSHDWRSVAPTAAPLRSCFECLFFLYCLFNSVDEISTARPARCRRRRKNIWMPEEPHVFPPRFLACLVYKRYGRESKILRGKHRNVHHVSPTDSTQLVFEIWACWS